MLISALDLYWLFPHTNPQDDSMVFKGLICLVFLIDWMFVVWRHRSNIAKLIEGTENKVKMFSRGR
jgi:glycerol-3-phosphate acyltransferase PlsY